MKNTITDNTKRLFEKILYRGYRNDALNRGISEPSDDSPTGWLFTTDKPSHAEEFSQGQTTKGSEMVFEEYDIPDSAVDKLYNKKLSQDPLKARQIIKYTDTEKFLKDKGYLGYIDNDTIMYRGEDDPQGYGTVISRADEYVFFDKPKYSQYKTNKMETDNGEWSQKQIEHLESLGIKRFEQEREEKAWQDANDYDDPHFAEYLEELEKTQDMEEDERAEYYEKQRKARNAQLKLF